MNQKISQIISQIKTNPREPSLYIDLASAYLEGEQTEKAKNIVIQRGKIPSDNPEIHFRWGLLCEELGLMEDALSEFNSTLKLDPNYSEANFHLGLIYQDKGQVDKAIKFFQKTLQANPAHLEAGKELGLIYEECGDYGSAKMVYEALYKATGNNYIKGLLDSIQTKAKEEEAALEEEKIPSEEDVKLFHWLFSGREGVYARQWVDETGKSGYTPIHEPFTHHAARNHLLGNLTAGLYLLRNDNTVKFMAIDVDVSKKILQKYSDNPKARAELEQKTQQSAAKIAQICNDYSIPVYIEDSGHKGRHCWVFFSSPIEASMARRLGEMILREYVREYGQPEPFLNQEIFPKQEAISEGGLGSLIKLPLGIHRKTGRKCLFLDREGNVYGDQFSSLKKISPLSRTEVEKIFKKWASEKAGPFPSTPSPAAEAPIFTHHPQLRELLGKCQVVNFLVSKAQREHDLTHEERLALLCIIGHMKDGRDLLHQIMKNCLDYNEKYTENQIKHMKPMPISCPKIRKNLPRVTSAVECVCEFPLPPNGYPSPLLHLNPNATAQMCSPAYRRETDEIDLLVQRYLNLKKEEKSVKKAVGECEKRLAELFDSEGIERKETRVGVLIRSKENGTDKWTLEI